MKPIVAGVLATIATFGLLSACSDDAKLSAPNDSTDSTGIVLPGGVTLPPGVTLPDGVTLPPGVTLPAGVTLPPGVTLPAVDISDISVPEELIDQMIAQFEAAGMKVDKACFTALLQDESLRKMIESGGAPNQDTIKKFFTCLST